jgi:competence protein ComEC
MKHRNFILGYIYLWTFIILLTLIQNENYLYASQNNRDLIIHFIDVGKGDSTFILLPWGENILVDVGSPSGGVKVVQYLKHQGIKKINHLILTHPHYDHIGGIFYLESEFEILNFYDNGFSNFESEFYTDYVKYVRNNLLKYHILQAGESLNFGKIYIEVLNPQLPPTGNLNTDSIVLRIIYNRIKILLTGDLDKIGEKRLLKSKVDISSNILKIAHHGDNDAASEYFLKNVKPEVAVISISMIDRFARPNQNVLKRLNRIGTKIYRTDLNGNIIIKTDGKSYLIETEK